MVNFKTANIKYCLKIIIILWSYWRNMKQVRFAHLKQHVYYYQCSSMKICLLPVFLVFTSPNVIWLSCVFTACLCLGWVWLTYFMVPPCHTHTPIPDLVWVFIYTSCSISTWSLQPLFVSSSFYPCCDVSLQTSWYSALVSWIVNLWILLLSPVSSSCST